MAQKEIRRTSDSSDSVAGPVIQSSNQPHFPLRRWQCNANGQALDRTLGVLSAGWQFPSGAKRNRATRALRSQPGVTRFSVNPGIDGA
jgi:hypothetical protein